LPEEDESRHDFEILPHPGDLISDFGDEPVFARPFARIERLIENEGIAGRESLEISPATSVHEPGEIGELPFVRQPKDKIQADPFKTEDGYFFVDLFGLEGGQLIGFLRRGIVRSLPESENEDDPEGREKEREVPGPGLLMMMAIMENDAGDGQDEKGHNLEAQGGLEAGTEER
jgi:hypothetical protein